MGSGHRFFLELFGRHDAADKARTFCFLGIHEAARQMHLHRFGFANKSRQTLCAAKARHNAKIDFRLPEFRRFGCNDKVTHHRKFAPSAQSIP